MAIIKRIPKGSPLSAAEMDANLDILESTSGSFTAFMTGSYLSVSASVSNLSTLQGTLSGQFTGSALISGSLKITSASISYDNSTDKVMVFNPSNNTVGWSRVSGLDGTAGTSGISGTSGTSGINGTSGTSGVNGTSGTAGTSGLTGTNGTAGTSGVSGTSGQDGTLAGADLVPRLQQATSSLQQATASLNTFTGSVGRFFQVTSSLHAYTASNDIHILGISSYTSSNEAHIVGISTFTSSQMSVNLNTARVTGSINFTTASLNTFTGSIRAELNALEAYTASLKNSTIISGAAQITALGFSAGGGAGDSIFKATGSKFNTTNNLEITGSLQVNGTFIVAGTVSGSTGLSTNGALTASLRQGYVWVGGRDNLNVVQIPTSSLGGAGGSISVVRGGNTYSSVTTLNFNEDFTIANPSTGLITIDVAAGIGGSGTSGTSGTSGLPGTSGTSADGTSGTSGSSGSSLAGTDGTSGTSAIGSSGTTGSSGVTGTSGSSGTSGVSQPGSGGTSGSSGQGIVLGVRDGGITQVLGVTDITFSGSVVLTSSGSSGVIVTLTGGNGGSFSSASYDGWITGSQQIIEAGFVQSSSGIFKDFIVTQSMVRDWSVTNNGNDGYVFLPTNDPTLERGEDVDIWVQHGDTIVFNVNAASHPFYIKTSVTSGTGQGVTGVNNNGATAGIVSYNTSGSVPGSTIFYCSSANTNLSGPIYIKERQRRTQFKDGRIVHTGSMWVDGGVVVTGSIWFSGSLYQNGVPFVGGGGGGPFAQTGSYYSANGDVFVTGSLRVSGSITASAITVTSPGTPEIYSATNINLNAGNVVVITSSSLRLAQFSDGQTGSLTPVNGDIYYNSTTNKFMGRISGSWIDFTSGSSVGGGGGASGTSGTSGTAALSSFSGTTENGVITYGTSGGVGNVETNLKFDGAALEVSSSVYIQSVIKLASSNPLPTGQGGMIAVSASLAGVSNLYFHNGTTWVQLN